MLATAKTSLLRSPAPSFGRRKRRGPPPRAVMRPPSNSGQSTSVPAPPKLLLCVPRATDVATLEPVTASVRRSLSGWVWGVSSQLTRGQRLSAPSLPTFATSSNAASHEPVFCLDDLPSARRTPRPRRVTESGVSELRTSRRLTVSVPSAGAGGAEVAPTPTAATPRGGAAAARPPLGRPPSGRGVPPSPRPTGHSAGGAGGGTHRPADYVDGLRSAVGAKP